MISLLFVGHLFCFRAGELLTMGRYKNLCTFTVPFLAVYFAVPTADNLVLHFLSRHFLKFTIHNLFTELDLSLIENTWLGTITLQLKLWLCGIKGKYSRFV